MPRSPVPYDGNHQADHSVAMEIDIPGRDELTAEKIEDEPKYDDPIDVRIVADTRPRRIVRQWSTSRVTVPVGKTLKVSGSKPNRVRMIIKNDSTDSLLTEHVLVSPDNSTNDYLGYALFPRDTLEINTTDEVWATHVGGANAITLSISTETVVEID